MAVLTAGALLVLAGCGEPEVRTYEVAADRPAAAPEAEVTASAPVVGGSVTTVGTGVAPVTSAAGAGRAGMPEGVVPRVDAALPQWQAPAHWVPGAATGVRQAAWTLGSPQGGTAEVVVTVFPGNVGGPLANVNRWRGELALPPITNLADANLMHRDVGPLHIDTVLLVGPSGTSTLASFVPHAGRTWFFKMMGATELVMAAQADWEAFLDSLSFPGA